MVILIWYEVYPDYETRFAKMAQAAKFWMDFPDSIGLTIN